MVRLSAFAAHDQHIAGTKYYRSRNFITRVRTQEKDRSMAQTGLELAMEDHREESGRERLVRILTRLKPAVERDLVCLYGSAGWS